MSGQNFDEKTGTLLEEFGQRMSRRGLLATVGKLLLKTAGVAIVPLLPVDRAYAQFSCQNDWQLCGLKGFFCKACCGQGAQYSQCPTCTFAAGSWGKCCYNPNTCRGNMIIYRDCVGTKSGYTNSQAAECMGSECNGGAGQQSYNEGLGQFRCTVIQNSAVECTVGQGACPS